MATNSGGVTTFGLFADGMVAQSIGGGGGQGGAGNAKTTAVGDASVGLNLAIGASGGAGGDGGAATAANALGGIIVTGGNNSRGVLVQSIGAGGGNGGGGGGSTSSSFGLSIGLGSSGATGGAGGAVTAWNYGAVTTRGDWSDGLLAQSIGGGGGNGGAGDSSLTVTSGQKFDDSYAASGQYSSTGAATNGAQSKPTSDIFTMSLGTTGGGGGDAGSVVVGANAPADDIAAFWSPGVGPSTILTFGNISNGLSAQSIGGGGGNAAIAPASSSAVATLDIGAKGAGGGAGGKVFVYASNIATSGFSSHGVLAQSVGGGGGMGVASGVATTITTRLGSENVALETGAGAGSSNDGGGVYVTTQPDSTISTGGPVTVAGITSSATDAFGILAQSIGGGGGSAAAAMGDATSSSGQGTKASHSITLGGKPSASAVSNNGAQAMVIHQGAIVTAGARDFGIVVQSVGGGGGLVSGDANSLSAVTFTPGARGDGGDVAVSLSNGASVRTQGDGAFGVLAQSVGGGGGFAAD